MDHLVKHMVWYDSIADLSARILYGFFDANLSNYFYYVIIVTIWFIPRNERTLIYFHSHLNDTFHWFIHPKQFRCCLVLTRTISIFWWLFYFLLQRHFSEVEKMFDGYRKHQVAHQNNLYSVVSGGVKSAVSLYSVSKTWFHPKHSIPKCWNTQS